MKAYEDLILFGGIALLVIALSFMDMKTEAAGVAQSLVGAVAMYLKGRP